MISRIYAGLKQASKQAGEEDLVEMKDKFHMEIKSIRFEKINLAMAKGFTLIGHIRQGCKS
jgi:hypothetical protein